MQLTDALAVVAVAILASGNGAGANSGDKPEGDRATVRRAVIPVSSGTGGPGTPLTQAEVDSPRPSGTREEMAREMHTTAGRYDVNASDIADALEADEARRRSATAGDDDDE